VSRNVALKELYCYGNQLTALDVSRNTALEKLHCDNNQFTSTALNALFETLHGVADFDCEVHIYENPGTEDCDEGFAEKKEWKVINNNIKI
jgi:hypothetical protein